MLMLSRHLPSTRALQCYLAVAQELNFRRAAELLNMSQPPLSRQIKALEELLRVQLFHRDTHGVRLTEAGEAFKAEAYQLLLSLDAAVAGIQQRFHDDHASAGAVRIGLTSVINHRFIAELSVLLANPAFTGERPLVRAWSKFLVEQVRSGDLDIAIVGDIVGPSTDLALDTVLREPLVVALPAAHAAAPAGSGEIDLAAMGDTPLFWLSRNDNPAFYDKCERVFRGIGYAPPRRPEPKDFTVLLAAIAAGEGVALCPQSMQATSHIGVAYQPLAPRLAQALCIDVQIVSRAHEPRAGVAGKIAMIRQLFGTQR